MSGAATPPELPPYTEAKFNRSEVEAAFTAVNKAVVTYEQLNKPTSEEENLMLMVG